MSWLDEAKRLTIRRAASEAGLKTHRSSMECPACGATKRGTRDRRLPVSFGALGWRCWACDASGDALDVLAYRVTGARLTGDRDQLDRLRQDLESRGLISEQGTRPSRPSRAPTRPEPPPEPEPSESWPPLDEILDFYRSGLKVSDDDQVVSFLQGRYHQHADRLIAMLEHLDLARAIPDRAHPKWARLGGRRWREQGYRLMFPLVDAGGIVRSLRVRRTSAGTDLPKAIPPVGYGVRGLVLACDRAAALLRSEVPEWWPEGRRHRLVIVEGETDWMTWLSQRREDTDPALVALYSGSWLPAHSSALPHGSILHIRTDHDNAGHRYAEGIMRASRRRPDLALLRGAP